jgi:hypothetical protein
LADDTGAAVILVRHLRKSREDGPALLQGGGSIGIVGAARSGILVAKDPHNPEARVLASMKMNLGPMPTSLAFELESTPNGSARVVWRGNSLHTAETLLTTTKPEDLEDIANAADYLKLLLQDQDMDVADVLKKTRAAGITDSTLAKARRMLGVTTITDPDGVAWSMPWPNDE